MTSRERVRAVLAGDPVDRCGLWLGNPHEDTLKIYCDYFGVDCIHPLQAKAVNMDVETLARDFKGSLAFMGGVDTQDLLVNAIPGDVKAEVVRLVNKFGPQLIVSPSHEKVLPDIPPENIRAMCEAAT